MNCAKDCRINFIFKKNYKKKKEDGFLSRGVSVAVFVTFFRLRPPPREASSCLAINPSFRSSKCAPRHRTVLANDQYDMFDVHGPYFYGAKYRSSDALPAPDIFLIISGRSYLTYTIFLSNCFESSLNFYFIEIL